MKNSLLLLFLLTINSLCFAQYEDVSDVPNPKTNDNGYVSNPDGILSASSEIEINGILANIELQDSFQVALVCLNSIGTNVPKDFATDLFNEWKIGLADKDNGLLVLFVLDQRRIEFETGNGTESVLTDYQCTQIIDEYMISDFKSGNYDKGLVRGMNAVANHFSGKIIDSSIADAINRYGSDTEMYSDYSVPFYQKSRFWLIVLAWQLLYVIGLLVALLIIRFHYDPYKKYGIIRYFKLTIYFFLFPISYLFLFKLIENLKERYRNMIRFSGKTGELLHKLEESEEDKYLTQGQITEEIIQSVDYDVWIDSKAEDSLILAYRPLFSSYSKCPKCGYQTYIQDYDRELVAATTYSSGSGERKYSCRNCKHEVIRKYTIPRIQKSSSTSSGGWSSGGSSSGWSGGGGGGSWGGGSSSGGGGGRSW